MSIQGERVRRGSNDWRRLATRGGVIAVAYVVSAQLGLALAAPNEHITAVWPPTGIALAALLLYGNRLWPAVAAGAALANVLHGVPLHLSMGIAVGNTIAPLAAATLLRRLDARAALDRLRDVVWLIFLGGLGAMTISATLGTWVLAAGGIERTFDDWMVWWVGDAMGVILVAPLILTFLATPLRDSMIAKRWKEAVALLTVLAAATTVAVITDSPAGYVVVPIGLWISMRLEQHGAAAAVVIMTAIDVWSTAVIDHSSVTELMTLQGVNATLAMVYLLSGVITHERRCAKEELEAAARELEERVANRTAALVEAKERLEGEVLERRVTESALRASEERLEQAQRLAHIGSFHWDANTDRNTWSDELFRIYGLDPTEGPPGFEEYLAFVRPDKRDEVRSSVEVGIASGTSIGHEYPIVLRDGTRKWVLAYIEVLRDDEGELLGLRGACQDVTDRKRAEEAMRWSEQRFRTLLESAPDAVVVVNPQGKIVLMNGQTTRLFGYEREELLGANVDILLPEAVRADHAQHRWRYAAQPATRPMGAGKDLFAVKKDGTQIPVDVSLAPVETEAGFLVFALVRDASERRAVEEALRTTLDREREASEHLRQLDQAKNVFLSAVSHELRTPLTAILGFAELLGDEEVRSSEEMTVDLVDRLQASATRLAELLADLLDIDRLNRGILEPRRRATSLHNLIERALMTLDCAGHPLQLNIENAVVLVDPAQTERIVENLVSNAVKYTPAGTPIELRAAATAGAGVNIVVEDGGPGISEEIRKAIFEPFVRGSTDGTFTQGTGIGLALVDRFARLHGGRAWLTERPGGGASFHVLLCGPNENGDVSAERSAVA